MAPRARALIVDRIDDPFIDSPARAEAGLADLCDVFYCRVRSLTEAIIAQGHVDWDVIVAWPGVILDPPAIQTLSRCKLVVRPAVGYDDIDLVVLQECSIALCSTPSYGTEEVADHAMALILGALRSIWPLASAARLGKWDWRLANGNRRLRGQTVGILGLGRIGTAVALRAQPFGLRVLFFDPYRVTGTEKSLGIERATTLDSLISQSDILTLHAPLNVDTHHIIGERELSLGKRGLVLVNTARGGLVDSFALVNALESGQVSVACLDVVEGEPIPLPALLEHEHVQLTMHSAFYSPEALEELRNLATTVLREYLIQGTIENRVV